MNSGINVTHAILKFFLIAFSCQASYSQTICEEPSDGVNRFHLIWLGNEVPQDKLVNVVELWGAISTYIAKTQGSYELNVWTNAQNLKNFFGDDSEKHVGTSEYKVRNVDDLISDEPQQDRAIYEFYLDKKIYAGAADYLRLLAVKKHGGCYLDLGFRIKDINFLSKERQRNHQSTNYYTILGGAHVSEDPRPESVAGPHMKLMNGFFAASKDHPILKYLHDEVSFKNKFFSKHRPIIEALFDNCSTGPIVMSLIGQWAYNDVYRSLYTKNKDLFDQIVQLDWREHLPYKGASTWVRDVPKKCGLLVSELYRKFHDNGFNKDVFTSINADSAATSDKMSALDFFTGIQSENKEITSFSMKMKFGERAERIAAHRVLLELLRRFRKSPQQNNPLGEDLSPEYFNAIANRINATTNIGMKRLTHDDQIVPACVDAMKKIAPNAQRSNAVVVLPSAPVIVNSSLLKELNLSIDLRYFVDTDRSGFDVNAPKDYFGHIISSCGELFDNKQRFQVFLPVLKIPDGAIKE